MNEYISLIKSDVVPATYDELWADISSMVAGKPPAGTLVIVNAYSKGSIEEMQLKKMLDACGLTGGHYNIIMLADGQPAAWHGLREKLEPKFVFLIGISPVQLGISSLFNLNEPNHFSDCVWLPTVSLRELEQHAEVKKQLWQNGMKPMFVDKRFGGL